MPSENCRNTGARSIVSMPIHAAFAPRNGGRGGNGKVGRGKQVRFFELTFGDALCSFDTMIPEDKLTGAESAVLTAFQAGGASIVDVAGAEIRGDFLRGLFLGEYGKNADCRETCIARPPKFSGGGASTSSWPARQFVRIVSQFVSACDMMSASALVMYRRVF